MTPTPSDTIRLWCEMLETAQNARKKATGKPDPEVDKQLKEWYDELKRRGEM